MEELTIFRIFSSFPLFGLLLPDISSLLITPGRGIANDRIYVESFLLLSVMICTAGIWYLQKQERTANIEIAASA